MTKTIVLGHGGVQSNGKKRPIKFYKQLKADQSGEVCSEQVNWPPSRFENIELVCRNYYFNNDGYDLMFAYDEHRNEGIAFLGYWNDGVIE